MHICICICMVGYSLLPKRYIPMVMVMICHADINRNRIYLFAVGPALASPGKIGLCTSKPAMTGTKSMCWTIWSR